MLSVLCTENETCNWLVTKQPEAALPRYAYMHTMQVNQSY